MIVIRRKTPRHNGTRYYAMPNQVQHFVDHAAKFDTPEAAETARKALREPRLWESMPEEDAARLDAQEREQHRTPPTQAVPIWMSRERKAFRLYAAIAAASARGMAV